ncbi:MAG: amidohydrolase family protein [Rhizobiales bacterium]|nr:amidohydrolase family protein [Hyphomicrobiales bacterium]
MIADLIITNARVITMDREKPFAEALAIRGNSILRVGSAAAVMELKGATTRVHDNKGNTVIPGVIEGHVHLFIGAAELPLLNIYGIHGFDAIAAAVRDYRARNPRQVFLHVIGATHEHFGAGTPITRHLLDRIVADVPFAIGCFDHHTCWANTKALEVAGILNGRTLNTGNEIVMGADGLATGELREFEAFAPILAMGASGGRESLGIVTGRDPDKVTLHNATPTAKRSAPASPTPMPSASPPCTTWMATATSWSCCTISKHAANSTPGWKCPSTSATP